MVDNAALNGDITASKGTAGASVMDMNSKIKMVEEELRGEREEASKNISAEKAVNVGGEVGRKAKDATYVGWKQIVNWEEKDTLTAEDELIDLNRETLLDNILPDKFYGDWYHATGIFFVGGLLSFSLGHFKFSLAPVFLISMATAILYRTSSKKYRASIRELVQKEFTVQKIENDYESLEWINNFLDKYWPRIEPAVSQMVVQQANELLATHPSIPAFVKAIWIDQFTLGIKPPRVDLVKTFQNTDADVVVMDWGVSFTPHDLTDMNAKQTKNYVNQKCVIKAKLFGLTAPVSISNVAFKANTRVSVKLMTPFPHIETVNIQLQDVPDIDFVAMILGDSIFNWEILAIPGMMPLINQLARKYMGPVLLPPFSLQLNIPQLLSGSALSIGVLEITIKNAKNLKRSSNLMTNSIDPYVSFELLGKAVGKTRTVRDSLNPVWNETIYVLLGTFTDPLTMVVYDKREKYKDKSMGRIEFNLNSLHDTPFQRNITANFLRNSKSVGEMNFDLHFFPSLESKILPDGTVEDLPDLNTGITKVVIEEACGLGDPTKKISAYVELYLGAKLVLTTNSAEGTDTLNWNQGHECIITDRRKTRYKVLVKDSKGEVLGSTVQTLNDLIDRTEIDKKNIPLKDSTGELKITTYWKPVALDIGSASIAYNPPIGVVRVFINKASDLINLEKIGKIDPYVSVKVNGLHKGRTDFKDQTLNPIFNQAVYVAVTSPNQRITLDCMDVETAGNDRTVGKVDLKIQDLFMKDHDDKYMEKIDDQPKISRLITPKGPRGTITYYTSFYPTLSFLTLEEVDDVNKIKERKKKLLEHKSAMKIEELTSDEKNKFQIQETEIAELEGIFESKQSLDLEELIKFNSGVLAISVLDGELPNPGLFVQSFFDANGHARFVSPKIATRTIQTGWSGDVMIKELEWSVCTFKVSKKKNANKAEDCLCEVTIPTLELVKNCYYKPSILNLSGSSSAKLMVQASWFPVLAKELPESDLITNSGDLTITAKSAENLISADSNGFSDPYLKFYLDDEEDYFFKTKTIRKTLNPTWNASTSIQIDNRVNEFLRIKVMDWDARGKDDFIGRAVIPLSDICPSGLSELNIPVIGPEGENGGVLHLSFEFTPRYTLSVSKRETKVGDLAAKGFGAGLRAGSTVVGAGFGTGLKAGSTVIGTIGNVGKFGKGLFTGKMNKGQIEE